MSWWAKAVAASKGFIAHAMVVNVAVPALIGAGVAATTVAIHQPTVRERAMAPSRRASPIRSKGTDEHLVRGLPGKASVSHDPEREQTVAVEADTVAGKPEREQAGAADTVAGKPEREQTVAVEADTVAGKPEREQAGAADARAGKAESAHLMAAGVVADEVARANAALASEAAWAERPGTRSGADGHAATGAYGRGERGGAIASPGIGRETELLAMAQRAMSAGQPERALVLLEEHARSFPGGALLEERSAARIIALCQAGHAQEARAEARSFVQQHQNSPLMARVAATCSDADRTDGASPLGNRVRRGGTDRSRLHLDLEPRVDHKR